MPKLLSYSILFLILVLIMQKRHGGIDSDLIQAVYGSFK